MIPYPIVPFFNFLTGGLALLLLPWRLHSWNVGICSAILWTSTLCFCCGINAVVWKDNVDDVAPVWCEIVTRLMLDGSVAIPACSLATIRRLYLTTCSNDAIHSQSLPSRLSRNIGDLAICFGFPILVITPLYYVVQGHSYNIFEEVGCRAAIVNTQMSFVLIFMWPVLFGTISVVYSILIVRVFLLSRKELNEVLTSNNTAVSYSLFYRVFILTAADAMFTIPLGILVIYINAVQVDIYPFKGWADIHYDFSRVDTFTVEEIAARHDPWLTFSQYWSQWIYVLCALVLFLVYGTSIDFVRFYLNVFWSVLGWMGFRRNERDVSKEATIQFASVAVDKDSQTTKASPAVYKGSSEQTASLSSLSPEIPKEYSQESQ